MMEQLERLAAARIRILPVPGVTTYFFMERDGFVALVERVEAGFGKIGAPGLLTEKGFAALVWRGEQAFFVARGFEERAQPFQVEAIRGFADDLKAALA